MMGNTGEYTATGRINSLRDMWRGLIHVTSMTNMAKMMNIAPLTIYSNSVALETF
jgi:hypothetical protein